MTSTDDVEIFTQTTGFPEVRVRRSIDGATFDEEWRVLLADGEPHTIEVRSIRTRTLMGSDVGGGPESVDKGEWHEARARYVPGDVVAEVEKHMVPRGQFA